MRKRWTNAAVARQVADALTDSWMCVPKKDRQQLQHKMARLMELAVDCPECEICCAIGLCCPPGSEQQRASLTRLLMAV